MQLIIFFPYCYFLLINFTVSFCYCTSLFSIWTCLSFSNVSETLEMITLALEDKND